MGIPKNGLYLLIPELIMKVDEYIAEKRIQRSGRISISAVILVAARRVRIGEITFATISPNLRAPFTWYGKRVRSVSNAIFTLFVRDLGHS